MVRRFGHPWMLAWVIAATFVAGPSVVVRGDVPERLSDRAFWELSQQLSEPDGTFRSDNLLSNELYYPEVLRDLTARVPSGGAYLGVGPEQNFHYIVALRPRMVFITDVRRGNLHLHLMYKALFELSADRADFVSRLFTKPRPAALTRESSVNAIMDAYWGIDTSARDVFDANLRQILDHLVTQRHLPLSEADVAGIGEVYGAFYWFGPAISYNSSSNSGFGRRFVATYYDLATATDQHGLARSFLASEEAFAAIKDLHARNLIVPVVGDFGGPRALRAVGTYLRDHGVTVSAFYLSNVEQYLRQRGLESRFCLNVASMPLDDRSTYIRSESTGGEFRNTLGAMRAETSACAGPAQPATAAP